MADLDAYFFCHKRPYSTYSTLKSFRQHYPTSTIFLISDNGHDYTEMAKLFNCFYIHCTESINAIVPVYRHCTIHTMLTKFTNLIELYIYFLSSSKSKFILKLEDDIYIQKPIDTTLINEPMYGSNLFTLPNEYFSLLFQNPSYTKQHLLCGHGGTIFHRETMLDCLRNLDAIQTVVNVYLQVPYFPTIIDDVFFSILYGYLGHTVQISTQHMEIEAQKDYKCIEDQSVLHDVKDKYNLPLPDELKYLVRESTS